jgi:integrase-like protein
MGHRQQRSSQYLRAGVARSGSIPLRRHQMFGPPVAGAMAIVHRNAGDVVAMAPTLGRQADGDDQLGVVAVVLQSTFKTQWKVFLEEKSHDAWRTAGGRCAATCAALCERRAHLFDGKLVFARTELGVAARSRRKELYTDICPLDKRIGLEGVTHHVLRHAGASAMVAAGISLRVVQDIGGWSTLRMLERYAHPSGAEMSRAVRVLTAYTATGTKTGTAPKNDQSTSKKRGRVSVVKKDVVGS